MLARDIIMRQGRYFKIQRDKKGRFTRGSNLPQYNEYEVFAHTSEKTKEGTSVKNDLTIENIRTNLNESELRKRLEDKVIDTFKKHVSKPESLVGKWHFDRDKGEFFFKKNDVYISVEKTSIDVAQQKLTNLVFTGLVKQLRSGNKINKVTGVLDLDL